MVRSWGGGGEVCVSHSGEMLWERKGGVLQEVVFVCG